MKEKNVLTGVVVQVGSINALIHPYCRKYKKTCNAVCMHTLKHYCPHDTLSTQQHPQANHPRRIPALPQHEQTRPTS
jgi:hypothetical protein